MKCAICGINVSIEEIIAVDEMMEELDQESYEQLVSLLGEPEAPWKSPYIHPGNEETQEDSWNICKSCFETANAKIEQIAEREERRTVSGLEEKAGVIISELTGLVFNKTKVSEAMGDGGEYMIAKLRTKIGNKKMALISTLHSLEQSKYTSLNDLVAVLFGQSCDRARLGTNALLIEIPADIAETELKPFLEKLVAGQPASVLIPGLTKLVTEGIPTEHFPPSGEDVLNDITLSGKLNYRVENDHLIMQIPSLLPPAQPSDAQTAPVATRIREDNP